MKVHMALCVLAIPVQLFGNPDVSTSVLHTFILVWAVGLVVLYVLMFKGTSWARLIAAFWTIPIGILLLAEPVSRFLATRGSRN